ncbi:MAG: hypothetical protein MJY85_05135 [Fibrobacter sp.]|nr:hypothetical protein [Fibrobacter sp.]
MKTINKLITLFMMATAISAYAADINGWATTTETLNAFVKANNRAGYVKPIIDNIGNVLNSNWFSGSTIDKGFAFEAGMPFALVPIGDDDKVYKSPYSNNKIPSIFGRRCRADEACNNGTIYGNETLNGLPLFTYPYMQMGFSFYHARLVLRGMWLPAISELQGFNLWGAGLQYSFGHLYKKDKNAVKSLDISLLFGYNSSTVKYQPKEYKSPLVLDITALTADVIIGYKPIKEMEIMATFGYQYTNMDASGKMTVKDDYAFLGNIKPDQSVQGNSGFKFGIEMAFTLGNMFHPVVGFDYAGKSSFTTNLLYFKQQNGKE